MVVRYVIFAVIPLDWLLKRISSGSAKGLAATVFFCHFNANIWDKNEKLLGQNMKLRMWLWDVFVDFNQKFS